MNPPRTTCWVGYGEPPKSSIRCPIIETLRFCERIALSGQKRPPATTTPKASIQYHDHRLLWHFWDIFCTWRLEHILCLKTLPTGYAVSMFHPMKFPGPLVRGTLIKRYKRFLADVMLDDGRTVTAHCANPGSMMGLAEPDTVVWLSQSDNPKRKLKFSWEILELGEGDAKAMIGINTNHPNAVVSAAIENGEIAELSGYQRLRREVKYGRNSRIDILLEADGRPPCYVEVKNAHLLRRVGLAEFPDSVTARGAKHLDELSGMVAEGARAVMFYLVQRDDAVAFALARDIDRHYSERFKAAQGAGVEALCYCCKISPQEIIVDRPLQFVA